MPLTNRLYYGDNLEIMRDKIPSQSVDLIYLDPPFKSDQNYNILYRTMTGQPVPDQKHAFDDAWKLDYTKEKLISQMPVLLKQHGVDSYYAKFWEVWIFALRNTQPDLLAYLLYMVERLLWMKSILKKSGSIYLHCDPTASHYIKVMMDGIFGHQNFRNEIVWERTTGRKSGKQFGRVHDIILFYTGSKDAKWNPPTVKQDESTAKGHDLMRDGDGLFRLSDLSAAGPGPARRFGERGEIQPPSGRHWQFDQDGINDLLLSKRIVFSRGGVPRLKKYIKELAGVAVRDVWTDIEPLNAAAEERLGYQTQKPIALLRRIIEASTDKGDVVFDPFCGCGTTIYAAQETGRTWIGCDIAILAVNLIVRTLSGDRFRLSEGTDFHVDGIPVTYEQAQKLADNNKTHFQNWSVESVGGFPNDRTSGDRGIDGRLYFETRDGLRSMVISVKGGAIKPADVRDLRGVLEREPDCEMGGFICLKEPTKAMQQEAAQAGTYLYAGNEYPRLQILTTKEILEARRAFSTPTRIGQTKASTGQRALPLR